MKGIVLYQSKYGATKKYVDWIVETTGFDFIETKSAKINDILQYDFIILAGGIYASGIAGLSFLKKNISVLKEKKVAVFCVGASPYEKEAFNEVYQHNFKDQLKGIPCFYGRGAWDENSMTFADRTLCKMLHKAVSKKDPTDYEIWEKALMCAVGQKCDWTEKAYLKSILVWIDACL